MPENSLSFHSLPEIWNSLECIEPVQNIQDLKIFLDCLTLKMK